VAHDEIEFDTPALNSPLFPSAKKLHRAEGKLQITLSFDPLLKQRY